AAMFSVEITVERDRVTGETRVLSTNTKLPVDLSPRGSSSMRTNKKAPGLGTRSAAGASEQKPVTMVFMGYQSVEDEDQTKKGPGAAGDGDS
ncbi:unnamed protein product, partial [Tetraodon nigroviridis]